jgi:plastocyanin
MKHLSVTLLLCCLFLAGAAQHRISINGNSYLPNSITVNVGDEVIIEANKINPLIELGPDSWHVNRLTPQNNGFSSASDYRLLITAAMAGKTIYFGSGAPWSGMRGRIVVNAVSAIHTNYSKGFDFTVYPNPVSTDSWISLQVNRSERITIQVFDMQGRIVRTFLDQEMKAGEIKMPFTLNSLGRGNYIVQMRNGKERINKQIMIR